MHICTAVEIFYLNRRLCLSVVGVGAWRVILCVWGLCLGVVGVGAWLVCVCLRCVGETNVYHTKRVSQLLILIKSEIALKNFLIFGPHFPKNFTSVCPLWDQNFNFRKKCVRQLFSLTKHVSKRFTLIKAKNQQKFFRPHFSKKFYKLFSPYGTKISILKVFLSPFYPGKNQFFFKNYSGVPPRCNLTKKLRCKKCPKRRDTLRIPILIHGAPPPPLRPLSAFYTNCIVYGTSIAYASDNSSW